MTVFFTDLDRTLIYSYKQDAAGRKRTVERYDGREVSFMTEKTHELLQQVKETMLIVPVSTRSIEQYERIDLQAGPFPYALTCNGGVLLVGGKRDARWYAQSLECIAESMDELNKAAQILEMDARRTLEVRRIEELFLFTKCGRKHSGHGAKPRCEVSAEPFGEFRGQNFHEAEHAAVELRNVLDETKVDVLCNGEKLYVVPKALSKGHAVRRLKEKLRPDVVIAAGDSVFDASMLKEADIALAPCGFGGEFGVACKEAGEGELFSEYVMEFITRFYCSGFCMRKSTQNCLPRNI